MTEAELTARLAAQVSTVAAYRFAFDPLRKYPGPWLAAFTDAYTGYHALRQHIHLVTYQNHQKYGL